MCRMYVGSNAYNRPAKGNMWSTIPVALLCMIVNWSEGKRAALQKETKSCRTQGDFCSFSDG